MQLAGSIVLASLFVVASPSTNGVHGLATHTAPTLFPPPRASGCLRLYMCRVVGCVGEYGVLAHGGPAWLWRHDQVYVAARTSCNGWARITKSATLSRTPSGQQTCTHGYTFLLGMRVMLFLSMIRRGKKGMGVTASWFPAAESNALFVTRAICIRRSPENKHTFGLVEGMEMETDVQPKQHFVVTTPSQPDVASSCRMSHSVFYNLHRLHSNGFLSPRPMSLAPYVSAWAPALGESLRVRICSLHRPRTFLG